MSIIDNLPAFEAALNKKWSKRSIDYVLKVGDEVDLSKPNLLVFVPNENYQDYGSFEPAPVQSGIGRIIGKCDSIDGVIKASGGYNFMVCKKEDYQDVYGYMMLNIPSLVRNITNRFNIPIFMIQYKTIPLKGLPVKCHVTY